MGKPKLAVWKFASCDGCQLTLLDCEDSLGDIFRLFDIAHFAECTSRQLPGSFDVSLVEGSVSTAEARAHIKEIRSRSRVLIAAGACATAGGIQALRNFADADRWLASVYPHPDWVSILKDATPICEHVAVDYELRGCPINKVQLLEVLSAVLAGRRPYLPRGSVCRECKAAGIACRIVVHGRPCLGPVTREGCGALCLRYGRACFGCFGPHAAAEPIAMKALLQRLGLEADAVERLFQTYNAAAPEYADHEI